MLVQFSVSNFKSIKEKQVLKLSKNDAVRELEKNLISTRGNNDLLRAAVIFGNNGSGKTNLLKALSDMRNFILNCHKLTLGDAIQIEPYLIREEGEIEPIVFELEFIKSECRYIYSYSVFKNKILEESLIAYPKNARQQWYERKLGETDKYKWKFGQHFKGEKESIKNRTLDNTLFLSKAAQENNPQAKIIFDFFRNDLNFVFHDNNSKCSEELAETIEGKDRLKAFFSAFRLGFESIDIETTDLADMLPADTPVQVKNLLKAENVKKLVALHTIPGTNKKVNLDVNTHGSLGLQRLFALAGHIVNALEKGQALFIDELDYHLHFIIVNMIIEAFAEENKNNLHNAQLVFTTHNHAVLEKLKFRRDQVWFAEKSNQETILYNLANISKVRENSTSVRKTQNLAKGFLDQKFYTSPKRKSIAQLELFDR